MLKSKLLRTFVTLGVAFTISSTLSFAQETTYPLTIKNCGRDLTFTKAPERVVSIGQNSTEILYLLGLSDRVAGTALWFSPVLDEFKEANDKIPVISQNIPSFEGIIGQKPDMIANQFEWQIGPAGAVASYEQFEELNVPVYSAPADCAKDNEDGGDGVRKSMFQIELVYQEIEDLAKIFNVQKKGAELIANLKAREEAAKKSVAAIKDGTSIVFWFSSADLELDPYIAGNLGPAAYIASTLGLKNIIDSSEEWPTIGWETIAKANPSIIALGEMTRRRFPADDWEVKMKFLKSDPVTKLIPAVKNDHLIVIDVQTMNAGVRTIDGLEKVADAITKFKLTQ